jgi:hypothetical protein
MLLPRCVHKRQHQRRKTSKALHIGKYRCRAAPRQQRSSSFSGGKTAASWRVVARKHIGGTSRARSGETNGEIMAGVMALATGGVKSVSERIKSEESEKIS